MRRLGFVIALACSITSAWAGDIQQAAWHSVLQVSVGTSYTGPCDALAANGSACGSAYSTARAMLSAYVGQPLFQLIRTSDSTTMNVSSFASGPNVGFADTSGVAAFCGSFNANGCNYNKIYDHNVSCGNDLPGVGATRTAYAQYAQAGTVQLPYIRGVTSGGPGTGSGAYSLRPGTGNFLPCTTGGNHSMMIYAVAEYPWSIVPSTATATPVFSRPESAASITPGHPAILGITQVISGGGWGVGPHCAVAYCGGIDTEDVFYSATALFPNNPQLSTEIATWCTGTSHFTIDGANAQSGTWSNLFDGPSLNGNPVWEGGIAIGEGGDASVAPYSFFEGAYTETCPTSAAKTALQANIVAAYSKQTNLGPYVGPGDTGVAGAATYWGFSRAYSSAKADGISPAIAIVRDGDGLVRTIVYLTNGLADTATMQDWCHGHVCWYGNVQDGVGSVPLGPPNNFDGAVMPVVTTTGCGNASAMCATFNGTSDYMETGGVSAPIAVAWGAQPITMSVVANRNGNTSLEQTLYYGEVNSPWAGLYFNAPNQVTPYSGSFPAVIPTAADNTLHSLIFIHNGASSIATIDGTDNTGLSIGTRDPGTGFVWVGKNGGGGSLFMTGIIDEITAYPTTALSSGDRQTLCHNQRLFYSTGGSC